MRKELGQNGYEWSSTRKCADGRVMDISNIGAKASDDLSPSEDGNASGTESEHTDVGMEKDIESPDEESADEADDESSEVDAHHETQQEQGFEKDNEQQNSEGGGLKPDEDPENIGDDESSPEAEIGDSQVPSIEAPDTDDVPTLKDKIIELKKTIIAKDKHIAELEQKVEALKEEVEYYEKEFIAEVKTGAQKETDDPNKMDYQPLSVS
jgi:hypothetical protein